MISKDLWYQGIQQKCVLVTYNKLLQCFRPECCTNLKKINKTSMTTKIIPNFLMAPITYSYKCAKLNRFNAKVLINETKLQPILNSICYTQKNCVIPFTVLFTILFKYSNKSMFSARSYDILRRNEFEIWNGTSNIKRQK